MQAWLMAQTLWLIVAGQRTAPILPASPTPEQQKALADWQDLANKAAGWLYLMISPQQRVYIEDVKEDPVKIWKKLKDVHEIQKAGSRFNAYDDLFSIRKHEDESLQSLMSRVDEAMQRIKNLCPANFDLNMLDDELHSMTLIRVLPEAFSSFVSSLLLLDKLIKPRSKKLSRLRKHRGSIDLKLNPPPVF